MRYESDYELTARCELVEQCECCEAPIVWWVRRDDGAPERDHSYVGPNSGLWLCSSCHGLERGTGRKATPALVREVLFPELNRKEAR